MPAEPSVGRRFQGTPALLEREAELELLSGLLAGARDGRGSVALIEGPPGVGKSALLEQAATMARGEDMRVLRSRGHELEQTLGWGVARTLLEAQVAAAGGGARLLAGPTAAAAPLFGASDAPAPESAFAVVHALYWLVVRLAERGPLAVVVDDAHWADQPSLRFLTYLGVRLAEQPVALLVG